jgi:hypothetical protein
VLRSGRRRLSRLLAYPGQALGLTALTTVLVAVSVSAPLFVASAGEGAWRQDRARLSETAFGATLSTVASPNATAGGAGDPRVQELDRLVHLEADAAGLPSPSVLTRLTQTVLAEAPGGLTGARVISRTGAAEAVHMLARAAVTSDRPEVLVPQPLADDLGLKPGDSLRLANDRGGLVRARVAGIYADVVAPLPAYWEGHGSLFLPQQSPLNPEPTEPPPVLIMSQQQTVDTALALQGAMFMEWFFPLPADVRGDAAAAAADGYQRLALRGNAPGVPLADLMAQVGDYPQLRTALPDVLASIDETVALLSPPVRAVGQGGAAAGLLLVGAWAAWRVRRRGTELRALVARGLSPVRSGWRVLAEALVPVLIGTAAGVATAVALVRWLGPVRALPPSEATEVSPVVGAATLAVLATVVMVTAALTARMGQVGTGPAQQLFGRVPWLAVTATVAVVAAVPLFTDEPRSESDGVGVLALAVPLLVVVAGTGLVVGVLQRLAPRLYGRLDRWPVGSFLGVRRVLAAPTATRLLVVSTALTLGLVVYASALAASTERTVDAKAVVAVGSDVVVELVGAQSAPDPLPAFATSVDTDPDVRILPSDVHADVLAVDTSRFASIAFWNSDLADRPLEDLMSSLQDYEGQRLPVVVAGPVPGGVLTATDGRVTVSTGAYEIQAQVVGRASAFPGMSSLRPLLVTDQTRLAAALTAVERDPESLLGEQVWARGDAEPTLAKLAAAGLGEIGAEQVQTAADFAARPALRAQTWTLGYLRAVAGAAALLGLIGLGLHAAAQHRRRTVAGVLLARMGLSRGSARMAAAVELGLLALLAGVLGAVFALPTSRLVLDRLDPVPSLPPEPLFALPGQSLAAIAGAVAGVSLVGAVLVDLLTRGTTGGEVLRDDS